MKDLFDKTPNNASRRKFLKNTGSAILGGSIAMQFPQAAFANPQQNNTLKVGLIGCGGRGTGAAAQALKADNNAELHYMADVFDDHLQESLTNLTDIHGDRVKVPKSRQFLGFDAFQKVIDSDVDVVILTTPPGFRPEQLEYAVNAGKHVFCEKPVAVDAPGVRRVLAAAEKAKQKNISLVSGLCWRYHFPKQAFFSKINAGAVGDISAVYTTYNTSTLWSHPRQSDWSDMEWELRNWLYFTWLSGDHITEQAVHSLDFMSWALGDKTPLSCIGTGGRQVRTGKEFGHIYDHFSIVYNYEDGVQGFHMARQQKNCANSYACQVMGSEGKGIADVRTGDHKIMGPNSWQYRGEENNMYQTEHDELFASIRNSKPINDGQYMAQSTMLAIMGRMAAYTGKEVTWDEAMKNDQKLGPDHYDMGMSLTVPEVAMPGFTEV